MTDVLIIGAGVAGLAAAQALREAGVEAVVLEARDVPGGRIRTDRRLGVPLDLGPAWLGGASANPVADLVAQSGGATAPWDFTDLDVHAPDGRRLPTPRVGLDQLVERLHAMRGSASPGDDQEAALERALDALAPEGDARLWAGWMGRMRLGMWQAAELDRLPLALLDHEEELPGEEAFVKSGLDRIVERLASGLDIRYGARVERIVHEEGRVLVETSLGRFHAARAIVTLPLGVLQAGDVAFEPPLPPAKQRALQRLGVSLMDKVILQFDRRFWTSRRGFGIADEPRIAFYDLERDLGAPLLLALTKTERARQHEALSDEEVVSDVMRLLRRIHPDAPAPTGAVVTRWATDPHAKGSYVHVPLGATPEDHDVLAEPFGRLHFAGDATSRGLPGTLQGAWGSGRRAAREAREALRPAREQAR